MESSCELLHRSNDKKSLGSRWGAANPFCLSASAMTRIEAAGVPWYCEADRRTKQTKLESQGSYPSSLTFLQSMFLRS